MSSSSLILLQFTFWLLMIFPLAFSRIFPMNHTNIILPLTTHQNLHNSTFSERRRLFSSPPTNVPFTHDDVILIVPLTAGSPPQPILMTLDTGSELPWLRCKQSSTLTTIFHHEESSSYTPVPCSSPVCTTQTQDLPDPATCNARINHCHVVLTYGDGTSTRGSLAQETFGIGSSTIPQTSFGCMDLISTDQDEDAIATGLMGMNRGRLSFINQMGLSKFSYCISGSDSTGVLVLGDVPPPSLPPLKYTPMITKTDRLPNWDRFAYAVQFEGIQVGSKLLPIPSSEFVPGPNGSGQTVLDSGTQFTFLIDPVYNILKTEFAEQTKSVLTVDPSYVFQTDLDLCFQAGSTQLDYSKLPDVTLMFSGAEIVVSGQKLLYLVPEDQKYCFTFGNSKLLGTESSFIGNLHQRNVWIEYDLGQTKIGFANDVNCYQAGQLLGLQL